VRGGGFPLPAGGGVWGGGCAPSPENFSLFSLKKAHCGGYVMHSDVLEVVVCCAQDAARLCDQFCQFFSDGMQFMGAYPHSP